MNEDELREGLRAAVAGEPPMRLDPDRMAAKAEIHTRRRRSMVGAAVGTLAVFGAVAIAPALTGQGGGETMSAAASSSAPPPSNPEEAERLLDLTDMEKLALLPDGFVLGEPELAWPPEGTSAPYYSRGELYERTQDLRPILDDRFAQVMPDASVVHTQLFGTAGLGDIDDGADSVSTSIFFNDELGDGGAFVQVMSAGPDPMVTECGRKDLACGHRLLSDGSVLIASVYDPRRGTKPSAIQLNHLRQDGEVVQFSAFDYNPTGTGEQVAREEPGLSWDQLITLATDESITVY
ncbi:hypothetical protein FHR81_003672 [Actinoalloteichus hoggarensis]|uniref:hypothetical protein n=1 Tax=Actinoalloteichus hoggarensis TaxID=1470176 RepID=UPI0012FD0047|nr:hypothetical protein [Actinoalloteichus hoggarensis]MBB5922615.1 hypothetical protein [Actinoalloteichus hoggarensis]